MATTKKDAIQEPKQSTCNPNQRDYWEGYGVAYCDRCCERLRTENDGSTLCIENLGMEDCPLKIRRGK